APLRREPVRLAAVKAQTGSYRTAGAKDPFTVPIPEKLALLRATNDEVKKVKGVFSAFSVVAQRAEHRLFASTEGSVLEQPVSKIAPELIATAVEKGRKTKPRTYRPHAVTAGYEA